jgi:hypothetical protein
MTTHGYVRVSTDGQALDAQLAALKAAGAEKVYSEKQSGAKTDRAALSRALAWVGRLDKKRTGCGVSCDPDPEVARPEEIFLGNQSGLRADLRLSSADADDAGAAHPLLPDYISVYF